MERFAITTAPSTYHFLSPALPYCWGTWWAVFDISPSTLFLSYPHVCPRTLSTRYLWDTMNIYHLVQSDRIMLVHITSVWLLSIKS